MFGRKLFLVLALVALLIPLAALLPAGPAHPSAAGAQTNRIQNPGFEEPTTGGTGAAPTSWTASTTSPYRDNVNSYAGNYTAYLHGASGSYTQTVTIVANSIYLFEAYAKANGSATETVKLEIRNSSGGVLDTFTWSGTNHGWLRHSTYFGTVENAWDAVVTLSISGDSSAEAWFDSVVLLEKTPGNCFIATAAYGSSADDHVNTLRSFRDSHMSTDSVGSAFVSAYYAVSPPLARFIDDHPSVKPVVRAGLAPAFGVSSTAMSTTPVEKMAVAGSMLILSGLAIVWLRRRGFSRGH